MYGQALKAWLGSGRVGVQWAGVLQRLFSMPIGCSGHLIRLEGTVHSDFETWTSLKNQQGSCGGRKGWSGSEGGCANSSAWVGSRMCKLLVPAPGHAFFFLFIVFECRNRAFFTRNSEAFSESWEETFICLWQSHCDSPCPLLQAATLTTVLCNPTTFPDFTGTQPFVLSYFRMVWLLPPAEEKAWTERLAEIPTSSTV